MRPAFFVGRGHDPADQVTTIAFLNYISNPTPLSSRPSEARGGIYALNHAEMCRLCVNPSTSFHSARDDKLLVQERWL